MSLRSYLQSIIVPALHACTPYENEPIQFDIPQQTAHGDFSTNVALILAKKAKTNPRALAQTIVSNIKIDETILQKIEIAGPGFINFFYQPGYLANELKTIVALEEQFGRSDKHSGKRANVEFVSANPTGPLTVGHGRNSVFGDTVASLLEWVGYDVDREYYFNNAGRQMRVLGDSTRLRYLQLLGQQVDFPETYYQGGYISEIAQSLLDEFGDSLVNEPAEGKFKERAEKVIFDDIKGTLKRLGIVHKNFFNENSLYEDGKIQALLDHFKAKGLSYEKDGATWLKLSELGNESDRVIVKSTGEPTYRLPDIAYHVTKFERGYDLIVDIFGSDHKDAYPDVLAALTSLGYPAEKVQVLIHQFVTILKDGEVVKMSTRKANYVTLDELVDEVGADVTRYFFNMRSISSHMNFDLGIAKKQSDENPVFYLQYAHARICSIIRVTQEAGLKAAEDSLELLVSPEEQALIKKLLLFPDVVLLAAEYFESHKITTYLQELAEAFHKFYTFCRIIGSEEKLAQARLSLAITSRIVFRNGLKLLGLSAPERM